MKPLTNYQFINNNEGHHAFVIIPYDDFVHFQAYTGKDGIPNAVVSKYLDGASMLQAWREHLMLSQKEMADRMGMSPAGYGQIETAKQPRKVTLEKAAVAMGINVDQLSY